MPTKRPAKTAPKRPFKSLPERYLTQTLAQCDRRYAIVRTLKERLKELIEVTGSDTPQRLALCEEAVWLQHRLSQLRVEAIESGNCDDNKMTQMVNSLSGLYTKLGIDKAKAKEVALSDLLEDDDDEEDDE